MADGYVPVMGLLSGLFLFLALFMPFLSEYNTLHSGFSKIGNNFKNLMKTPEPPQTGDVEILLPSQSTAPPENYSLNENNKSIVPMIVVLVIAVVLLGSDLVGFYVLGDGLTPKDGPISNF